MWSRIFPLFLLIFMLSAGFIYAQPSGGPYGPIPTNYEIPKVKGTVYYVSPDGDASKAGTSLAEPTSIESAIAKVVTGDAIILRGGVYRTGDLELNQQIVMQPYKEEVPVLKGTKLATDWELAVSTSYGGRDLWRVKWSNLFKSAPDDWWRTQREGRFTPLHKFNDDMVFVDGRFLQSAGWYNELNDDNFYIDYEEGFVYLAFDPRESEVEITAHDQAMIITGDKVNGKEADHKGPTLRGITFTQYAFHVIDVKGYYPEKASEESEHGKDVVGTTIEHCTISYGGRVGAFVLGDHFTMTNTKISDTSTEGLYIVSSADVLLERNIFTRNNIEHITGYYPSAVKIFNQTRRVVVNDNLVIDLLESNGIWYDVGNRDGVFTNNWLEGVGNYYRTLTHDAVYPSRNAFFFEISEGVRVAGNVFVNNDHGIMILNAKGSKVYNNTFVNSMAVFSRTRRGEVVDHFGWHVTTGPGVHDRVDHEFANNVMVSTEDYDRPLLYIWQSPDMCSDYPEEPMSVLDHNAYVITNSPSEYQPIWRSGSLDGNCLTNFASSEELNAAIPAFGKNSVTLTGYQGPLFQSMELGNFSLMEGFKGLNVAGSQPKFIKEIVGKGKPAKYLGAYPDTRN